MSYKDEVSTREKFKANSGNLEKKRTSRVNSFH
jgi:hypothetical protein